MIRVRNEWPGPQEALAALYLGEHPSAQPSPR